MSNKGDSPLQFQATEQKTTFDKSVKLSTLLVAVFIVTIIAGACGYFLGISTNQNTYQSTQRISFQPSPSSKIKPSLTPFVHETHDPIPTMEPTDPELVVNWKTYTNARWGISFKYPSDARVAGQINYSMLSSQPSRGITVEPPYQAPYSKWYSFALVVKDNPQNSDARTIIDSYIEDTRKSCSQPGCATIQTILDTLKQYKNSDVDGYIFHIGAETDSVMVVQVKNSKTYIYRMSGDEGYVTDYGVKLFDQILSTLKFNFK